MLELVTISKGYSGLYVAQASDFQHKPILTVPFYCIMAQHTLCLVGPVCGLSRRVPSPLGRSSIGQNHWIITTLFKWLPFNMAKIIQAQSTIMQAFVRVETHGQLRYDCDSALYMSLQSW